MFDEREPSRPIRTALGLLCVLLCLFLTLLPSAYGDRHAYADTATSQVPVDIAFVYDDSGSMCSNGNTSWCQAKYGLETLAAMVGESDSLRVFPLNADVFSVEGSTPQQRADRVHGAGIDSLPSNWTPADRVLEAANYLVSDCSASDKRYLVIAADGVFEAATEQDDDRSAQKAIVGQAVDICKGNGITVIYLEIGDVFSKASIDWKAITPDAANGVYEYDASTDSQSADSILNKLTEITANMFNRHELSSQYYDADGGHLTLPVSTAKLVVFAQGGDSSVGNLGGCEKELKAETADVRYADPPSDQHAVDQNLVGKVVTITAKDGTDIPAGTYDLPANGQGGVNFYYEPDVSIKATFTDSEGNERVLTEVTDENDVLTPGDYTVNLTLLDNCTGDNVTSALGLDNARFVMSGDAGEQQFANGEHATLNAGRYSGWAECDVVDDMTVSTEYERIEVYDKTLDASMEPRKDAGGNVLTENMGSFDDQRFDISITKDGAALSADDAAATELTFKDGDKDVSWQWEPVGESRYEARPHIDEGPFVSGYWKKVHHFLFGYDGTVKMEARLNNGHNMGYAETTCDYHVNPDPLNPWILLFLYLPLILIIAFLLWLLALSRLNRFKPIASAFNVYDETSFDNEKTAGGGIVTTLLFARQEWVRSNSAFVAEGIVPSEIHLRGKRFSFGRKAYLVNWRQWRDEGWIFDETCKRTPRGMVVTRNSSIRTDPEEWDEIITVFMSR